MKVSLLLILGSVSAIKMSQPTIADTNAREYKKNLDDWASGHGNNVPSWNSDVEPFWSGGDKEYVQIDNDNSKKEKMVTNTYKQDLAEFEQEQFHELVVPHSVAENDKDTAPDGISTE